MAMRYFLDDDGVVSVANGRSYEDWARSYEKSKKVARTQVGPCDVSTVFLGTDHGYNAFKPIVFETMIFGENSVFDSYQERYCTRIEALEGHQRAIAYARKNPFERPSSSDCAFEPSPRCPNCGKSDPDWYDGVDATGLEFELTCEACDNAFDVVEARSYTTAPKGGWL